MGEPAGKSVESARSDLDATFGGDGVSEGAGIDAVPVDTRERVLDAALDLFIEHGFDGTSMREIAERVGVTKAALYYYFPSKDDMLMALHARLHSLGRDALERFGVGPVTLTRWGEFLDGVVDQILAQRKIFLLHERNQAALEKLHREEHEADHEDFRDRLRELLTDSSLPLRDRVRMSASFGVVFSTLFIPVGAFGTTSVHEMGEMLREVIHDVLDG